VIVLQSVVYAAEPERGSTSPSLHSAEPSTRDLDHETTQLVTRFQQGEESAFCELYSLHFDAVFRYVRVVLRDHHAAEDVTQQTFTNALRALPNYERRAGTPFRAWLFRIARNEALTYVRKHSRIDFEAPEQLDGRLVRDPVVAPLGSLEWLSDNDLMLFVERLPLAQRQVLMLRYMVGLKGNEVAAVLDRTPQAVRKLEHRALRFLQLRLTATRSRAELSLQRTSMLIRVRRAPVLRGRRFALAMTRCPGGGLDRRPY
jgi:RNA polymerase sigma-70 factor (ECF subfamily)